jgi:hypothetical protein
LTKAALEKACYTVLSSSHIDYLSTSTLPLEQNDFSFTGPYEVVKSLVGNGSGVLQFEHFVSLLDSKGFAM